MKSVNLVKVADAFKGEVFRAKVDDLDNLLFDPELKFSESGAYNLINKIGKSPYGYFIQQPASLQRDLLSSMKASITKENILLLKQDDAFVYCSLDRDIEMLDPQVKFKDAFKNPENWELRREDNHRGIHRYVYNDVKNVQVNDYVPTVYVDMPMLYNGNMRFEVGLFKLVCSNGMIDKVASNDLSLKPASFSDQIVSPIINGVLQSLVSTTDDYNAFLNYLRHCELSIPDAKSLIGRMIEAKTINAFVLFNAMKYLNLMEHNKQIEDTLPKEFHSKYDFMDVITFYAQKAIGNNSQKIVEEKIFRYFYNEYKNETKAFIKGLKFTDYATEKLVLPEDYDKRQLVTAGSNAVDNTSLIAGAAPYSPDFGSN